MAYQYLSPELRVFHGESSLNALVRELDRAGLRKVVVITGRTLSQSDEMQRLQAAIGSRWAGVSASAREHSPVDGVEEAVRFIEASGGDGILAVGGGSAAVTARAAAIRFGEKKPLSELSTIRREDGTFDSPRLNAPKLPIFALPTTPSTAFAKAGTAVHAADGERLAMFDPKTRARAIFIHPALVATAPAKLVFGAALNAMANAVEALEAPRCDPFSEALLMQALRLISRGLAADLAADAATRERLVAAAILCGRGTEQGGTGLASVLAHAIGKRTHVANGIVNAIVLPHTMRFNAPVTGARASALLDALGLSTMSAPGRLTSEHVQDLLRRVQAPSRLREIGVGQEDLAGIAAAAMSDWSISRNPQPVEGVDTLLDLLRQAW
jgi:alcohol dehydrogenase class IV